MPGTEAYLASIDGETVGSTLVWAPGEDAEITFVATLPEARGRGISGRLLALRAGAAARPRQVRLDPDRDEARLSRLRALGYGTSAASRCGSAGSRRTPDRGAREYRAQPWRAGPTRDEQIDAAIDALSDPEVFSEAERQVARAAPRLQRILAEALGAGGWFGESHDAEVLKAATTPDEEARLTAVRTLLAEEARMGMMVGVAVGWALAEQLEEQESEPTKED